MQNELKNKTHIGEIEAKRDPNKAAKIVAREAKD